MKRAQALVSAERHHKLHAAEDLCYLAITPAAAASDHGAEPHWIVSVRPLEQYLEPEDESRFWPQWKRWLAGDVARQAPSKLTFLVIDESRDVAVSEECCRFLQSELGSGACQFEVAVGRSVEQKCQMLAGADQVVAMRLHACLIATASAVPTMGVAYCAKVEQFFASIPDSNVFPLQDWLAETFPHVDTPQARQPVCLSVKQQQARENLEILKSLI